MDAGVVPILATKADNREKDERINRDMAMLAAEYDLPLWNFWAALSDLPDRGLYIMTAVNDRARLSHEEASTPSHDGLEALNVSGTVTGSQMNVGRAAAPSLTFILHLSAFIP